MYLHNLLFTPQFPYSSKPCDNVISNILKFLKIFSKSGLRTKLFSLDDLKGLSYNKFYKYSHPLIVINFNYSDTRKEERSRTSNTTYILSVIKPTKLYP